MKGPIVGIDLGTTQSLVGILQDGRPTLLPNALGALLTPSVVAVDDGGDLLVGAAAEARALTHPASAARLFKRDMGTARLTHVGGDGFTAPDLSAAILRSLKADAEAALGQPIERAVITVPAYFGDLQRQATRDAGAIAGLHVERIINEPTAAALAYGLHQLDRELRAVVLDLGGGTFDVTVLEIIEGIIEIQGSAGDIRLGGEDFSAALAEWAIGAITRAHGAPADDQRTRARIREAAERAKRRLSTAAEARLVLPDLPLADKRRVDVELPIDRTSAEAAWAPLLHRMRGPIIQALRDAGVTPEALDEVLLVGGATRMPCVVKLAASIFGRMPLRNLPPDETVAHGAAVQAALIAGDAAVDELVVTDVAPFTMGVEVASKMGRRTVDGLFSPVLERGTVIPASRVESFYPIEENQRGLEIKIYQGEHAMCAQNTLLGQLSIKLPRKAPPGRHGVDVRFTYDVDGLLEVDVTVQATGKNSTLVIEQRPGALSPAQIAAARTRMARLKFHPREALPNRTALARADALYQELTGPARGAVGEALQYLQMALETQDNAEIEAARESLLALLGRFEHR